MRKDELAPDYAQGVPIQGENGLSDGVTGDDGWNHIENVFTWSPYEGLTVLRIGEVTPTTLSAASVTSSSSRDSAAERS